MSTSRAGSPTTIFLSTSTSSGSSSSPPTLKDSRTSCSKLWPAGPPVLAMPVGAIPDVIVDGRTGFIMENNTPECIAENVIRALNSPNLERIADAGKRYVEENFTFEKAVENWRSILEEI